MAKKILPPSTRLWQREKDLKTKRARIKKLEAEKEYMELSIEFVLTYSTDTPFTRLEFLKKTTKYAKEWVANTCPEFADFLAKKAEEGRS